MSDRVDLTDIPVVDNQCHPVVARQDADPATWRGHFTESPDPGFRAADGVHTVFYRRLVKAMAAFHGVSATEAAQADVMQPAVLPQGELAVGVDLVVADPEVAVDQRNARRGGLGPGGVVAPER